ncbi:MAG: pseudouridine-5'-phosphate glycosidase [Archangium sp.]|nr:pseudouridine-5'-phosphate glycosidase [Archangium sp.]
MKLVFSAEVAAARRTLKPLVALETSVLAQGLPYPHNVEAARRCEGAVREEGAVPASMAVLDGVLHVGIDEEQTRRLTTEKNLHKIGSRDLAIAVARKLSGGTTVSATCELAAAAGIHVFATGGLGGVHRGVEEHLDISQDLPALARWPVAVVCAGAKSVLDLPRTLELLETLSVPVVGVGTNDLPGFYSRETGLELEHRVDDPKEAAEMILARRDLKQGGMIFALPPPAKTSLKQADVEKHLDAALKLAKKKKIEGKAVTPFLLGEMVARTKGKTLQANLALLENNARYAAKIAMAFGWR